MARPYTKAESEVIKGLFLEAYPKFHCQIQLTCKHINIHVSTYHQWRIDDPEFKRATDEAREELYDKMEYSLTRDALNNGGTDRIFYMKCRMYRRGFSETPYVKVDVPKLDAVEGLLGACAKVTEEMLSGKLTTEEATKILSVLESNRKFIETVNFEQRLTNLEGKQNEQQ